MKGKISLITILTNNGPALIQFYRDVLGFQVKSESGEYVEFENEGVRFAICPRSVMEQVTVG
ncbi:MAG: VOC family protein [Candidatus Hodarchaeales archaeon]|jgi:catechol 2,3-dioxygenase-like lactoylglutathione lyase family enzyme